MAPSSHGDGRFEPSQLGSFGSDSLIEDSAMVFQAPQVHIGADVYVGHLVVLKGDTRAELRIGDGSWIGEAAYMQSAGGIEIGAKVGVGPQVRIFSSVHEIDADPSAPIMDAPLRFEGVVVGDGCDLGVGATLLPGTRLGAGVQVGAGAVVSGEFEGGTVIAGVPARVIRRRGEVAPE